MLVLGQKGSYDDAVKDAENIAIMNGMELGQEKPQKQSKRPDSTAGVMRVAQSNDGKTTIIVRSKSSGEDPTIEIQIKGKNPDETKESDFIYTIKKRHSLEEGKYISGIRK